MFILLLPQRTNTLTLTEKIYFSKSDLVSEVEVLSSGTKHCFCKSKEFLSIPVKPVL